MTLMKVLEMLEPAAVRQAAVIWAFAHFFIHSGVIFVHILKYLLRHFLLEIRQTHLLSFDLLLSVDRWLWMERRRGCFWGIRFFCNWHRTTTWVWKGFHEHFCWSSLLKAVCPGIFWQPVSSPDKTKKLKAWILNTRTPHCAYPAAPGRIYTCI